MTVVFTGPSGMPMALLWPNAPFRAVPEYVIEFSESAPIAFDAAATTEVAFCAAAPIGNRVTTSAAPVSVLSIRVSSHRTRLWRAPLISVPDGNRLPGGRRKGNRQQIKEKGPGSLRALSPSG